MLSQVERGETSPTLQVAAPDRPRPRAAALAAAAPRRGRRGRGRARRRAAHRARPAPAGHSYEILTPPLPGQRAELSRHPLAAGRGRPAGPGDPPMHEPGSRETALVESGRGRPALRRQPPRARGRRLRDLRRRPSPPFREPRTRAGRAARRGERRTAEELTTHRCPRACSTRSGRPTRSPPGLLYIDLHLVHEVTSPQAFDGLRLAGRQVRRPDRTLATADHNVPTDGTPVAARIRDELSRVQVRRSSATARSSGSRSTRWALTGRGSCT